jgi:hypothetical protein
MFCRSRHCTELELPPIGSTSCLQHRVPGVFFESCSVLKFGRKLDTLVPDHRADHDRVHSASLHFTNQGGAEIVPSTYPNAESFCGWMKMTATCLAGIERCSLACMECPLIDLLRVHAADRQALRALAVKRHQLLLIFLQFLHTTVDDDPTNAEQVVAVKDGLDCECILLTSTRQTEQHYQR